MAPVRKSTVKRTTKEPQGSKVRLAGTPTALSGKYNTSMGAIVTEGKKEALEKLAHIPPKPAAEKIIADVRAALHCDEGMVRRMIAERAYYLWQAEYYQHGRDLDHWFRAEREIRSARSLHK